MAEFTGPQELLRLMPFAGRLGITVEQATAEEVRGWLDWAPELCTAGGVLHGGVLMALADSLGGACAYLNLPPGAYTATTTSSTVFLRAVRGGTIRATARRLHAGSSAIVVQTDIDNDDRHVARTTQTQAILRQRASVSS